MVFSSPFVAARITELAMIRTFGSAEIHRVQSPLPHDDESPPRSRPIFPAVWMNRTENDLVHDHDGELVTVLRITPILLLTSLRLLLVGLWRGSNTDFISLPPVVSGTVDCRMVQSIVAFVVIKLLSSCIRTLRKFS